MPGAGTQIVLDETVPVPAGGSVHRQASISSAPAEIRIPYAVQGAPVRVLAWMPAPGAESGQRGYWQMAAGRGAALQGELRFTLAQPGPIRLQLQNPQREGEASVVVQIRATPLPGTASSAPGPAPERQAIVLGASLLFFAAVTIWFLWKFLPAWRARPRG